MKSVKLQCTLQSICQFPYMENTLIIKYMHVDKIKIINKSYISSKLTQSLAAYPKQAGGVALQQLGTQV